MPAGELPPRLAARRDEVVDALAAFGTPVTVLRASLVVAPGSSSVNLIASAVDDDGIVPVPDEIAPNYTTGAYYGAPLGGAHGGATRAGGATVGSQPRGHRVDGRQAP